MSLGRRHKISERPLSVGHNVPGTLTSEPHPARSTTLNTQNETVARLLDALDASHYVLSSEMLSAIRNEVEEIGSVEEPSILEDMRAHCAENIRIFVKSTRAQRAPSGSEIEMFRRVAMRRADRFIPLEALLHAGRVGGRIVWNWIVAEAGESATAQAAALHLTGRYLEYLNVVSKIHAQAHLEEQQRLVLDRERWRRDLIEDLLSGRFAQGEEFRIRLASLSFPLASAYLVAVARLRPPDNQGRPDLLQPVAGALSSRRPKSYGLPPFVVVRHDEVIAIYPIGGRTSPSVRDHLNHARWALRRSHGLDIVAGISTLCDGIGDVPNGFNEAHRALRVASLSDGSKPIVSLSDLSLTDYLVADADQMAGHLILPDVRSFVEEDAKHGGMLANTLRAYLDSDLRVDRTAQELFVHPNTVQYRLNKIMRITGMNVRHFWDLVNLAMSIQLLRSGAINDEAM
jgi:sugar diacid utilization regulator